MTWLLMEGGYYGLSNNHVTSVGVARCLCTSWTQTRLALQDAAFDLEAVAGYLTKHHLSDKFWVDAARSSGMLSRVWGFLKNSSDLHKKVTKKPIIDREPHATVIKLKTSRWHVIGSEVVIVITTTTTTTHLIVLVHDDDDDDDDVKVYYVCCGLLDSGSYLWADGCPLSPDSSLWGEEVRGPGGADCVVLSSGTRDKMALSAAACDNTSARALCQTGRARHSTLVSEFTTR